MYNVQCTIYKASYRVLYKLKSPYVFFKSVPNSVSPL